MSSWQSNNNNSSYNNNSNNNNNNSNSNTNNGWANSGWQQDSGTDAPRGGGGAWANWKPDSDTTTQGGVQTSASWDNWKQTQDQGGSSSAAPAAGSSSGAWANWNPDGNSAEHAAGGAAANSSSTAAAAPSAAAAAGQRASSSNSNNNANNNNSNNNNSGGAWANWNPTGTKAQDAGSSWIGAGKGGGSSSNWEETGRTASSSAAAGSSKPQAGPAGAWAKWNPNGAASETPDGGRFAALQSSGSGFKGGSKGFKGDRGAGAGQGKGYQHNYSNMSHSNYNANYSGNYHTGGCGGNNMRWNYHQQQFRPADPNKLRQADEQAEDLSRRLLEQGQCVTSDGIIEHLRGEYSPELLEQVREVIRLRTLEDAIRIFLNAVRTHHVVWSVADMENHWMRCKLQKNKWDYSEWAYLKIGPKLALHPLLVEVFPEFWSAQIKWLESTDHRFMTIVEFLNEVHNHRIDIGFKERVSVEDLYSWFQQTKGASMDQLGVFFNANKLGLMLATQNQTLSSWAASRREATQRYLCAITERSNEEVEKMVQEAQEEAADDKDLALRAKDFLDRWRTVSCSKGLSSAYADLKTWTRHVLDLEPPHFVKTMTLAFIMAAHTISTGSTVSVEVINQLSEHQANAVPSISPLEVAAIIKRELDAMPEGAPMGVDSLLRLEELSRVREIASAGFSLLSFVAESAEIRELINLRLLRRGTIMVEGVPSANQGWTDEQLLKEFSTLLTTEPKCVTYCILDAHVLANLEVLMMKRIGAQAVGDWASFGSLSKLLSTPSGGRLLERWGLTLELEACEIFSLWQSYLQKLQKAGGLTAVLRHFGLSGLRENVLLSLGLPPQTGEDDRQEPTHLDLPIAYEVAVLERLPGRSAAAAAAQAKTIEDDGDDEGEDDRDGTRGGRDGAGDGEDDDLMEAAREAEQEAMQTINHSPAIQLPVTLDHAIEALRACPLLGNPADYVPWAALFASQFGPLSDFLEENAGVLKEAGLRFLAIAPGSLASASLLPNLLRVPADSESNTTTLQAAVAAGDANLAAAALVGLAIDSPEDVESYRFELEAGLNQLEAEWKRATDGGTSPRIPFCVALLSRMPYGLCESVGKMVVKPALGPDAGTKALEVAERLGCTSLLGVLGHHWGISEWAACLLKPCARTPTLLQGNVLLSMASGRSLAAPSNATLEASTLLGGAKHDEDEAVEDGGAKKEDGDGGGEKKGEGVPPTASKGVSDAVVAVADSEEPDQTDAEPAAPAVDEPDADEEEVEEEICNDETASRSVQAQCVEAIRQGFLLNDESAAQLQKNLGGSLGRLSADLYREQHHFVFELLQNAADCLYHDGVTPKFKLVLNDDKLVALQNEVGFSEQNVRALCAVDDSTKPKMTDGRQHIGRKGIGFKSVFKITDTPTIHSGPWHFQFDANLKSDSVGDLKGLGFIVPKWVLPSTKFFPNWTTEIALPFKTDLGSDEKTALRRDLEKLDGALLLNLTTLRSVELEDSTLDPERPVRRSLARHDIVTMAGDVPWRIVEIRDNEEVRQWLSVDRSIPFQENSKEQIHITLSFPLPPRNCRTSREWLKKDMEPLPTYCYLPLRSFGWYVALHANFDVTASRNEIHSDKRWNVRIKEQLPSMFVMAFHIMKDHLFPSQEQFAEGLEPLSCSAPAAELLGEEEGGKEIRCIPPYFLFRFLPIPGALGKGESDFFRGLEAKLWQRFQSDRCVLAADGTWLEPSKVLRAPSAMHKVVPETLLKKHKGGMQYMHPSFEQLPANCLKHLGISDQDAAFNILIEVAIAEVHSSREVDIPWLRQVYGLLHSFAFGELATSQRDDELNRKGLADRSRIRTEKIANLRLLPQRDSRELATPRDRGVFMTVDLSSDPQRERLVKSLGISLVDPELLAEAEGEVVRRLLQQCEVQELSTAALLIDGVLPFLQKKPSEDSLPILVDGLILWSKCSQDVALMAECDRLLRSRSEGRMTSFSRAARAAVRLPVSSVGEEAEEASLEGEQADSAGTPLSPRIEFCSPGDSLVIFSRAFHEALAEEAKRRGGVTDEVARGHALLANKMDKFADPATKVLHKAFLEHAKASVTDLSTFVGFLQSLGVSLSLYPASVVEDKEVESMEMFEQLGGRFLEEKTKKFSDLVKESEFPATIKNDFASPALEMALQKRAPGLDKVLGACSVFELKNQFECTLVLQGGRKLPIRSQLAVSLRSSAWLTTSNAKMVAPCDASLFFRGDALSTSILPFLSLVEPDYGSPGVEVLLTSLGMTRVKSWDLLKLVRKWSSDGERCFTEQFLMDFYVTFHDYIVKENANDVRDAFKVNLEPLIFIPEKVDWTKAIGGYNNKRPHTNNYIGKWVTVKQCVVKCAEYGNKKGGEDYPWLSHLGKYRELELHYNKTLEAPFGEFGVASDCTAEMTVASIEYAVEQGMLTTQDLTLPKLAMKWLNHKRFSEEWFPSFRAALARCRATPLIDGRFVKWAKTPDDENEAEGIVQVYSPSPSQSGGQAVLNWELWSSHGQSYRRMGMTPAPMGQAAAAPGAPTAQPVAPPLEPAVPSRQVEDSLVEQDLRRTVSYIQLFLYDRYPEHYRDINAWAAQLSKVEIEVYESLKRGDEDIDCNWEDGALQVRDISLRGDKLKGALRALLTSDYCLSIHDDKVLKDCMALGEDILVLLIQAEKPGRSIARKMLTEYRVGSMRDFAALDLQWWLQQPPLPMEEAAITMAYRSRPATGNMGLPSASIAIPLGGPSGGSGSGHAAAAAGTGTSGPGLGLSLGSSQSGPEQWQQQQQQWQQEGQDEAWAGGGGDGAAEEQSPGRAADDAEEKETAEGQEGKEDDDPWAAAGADPWAKSLTGMLETAKQGQEGQDGFNLEAFAEQARHFTAKAWDFYGFGGKGGGKGGRGGVEGGCASKGGFGGKAGGGKGKAGKGGFGEGHGFGPSRPSATPFVKEGDPWASWAGAESEIFSKSVQNLDRLWSSPDDASDLRREALGHAVDLSNWAHLGRRPRQFEGIDGNFNHREGPRAAWARERSEQLNRFAGEAEQQLATIGPPPGLEREVANQSIEDVRSLARRMRAWGEAGANPAAVPASHERAEAIEERTGASSEWLWTAQKEEHLRRTMEALHRYRSEENSEWAQRVPGLFSALNESLEDLQASTAQQRFSQQQQQQQYQSSAAAASSRGNNNGGSSGADGADGGAAHQLGEGGGGRSSVGGGGGGAGGPPGNLQFEGVNLFETEDFQVVDADSCLPKPLTESSLEERGVGEWGEEWVYRYLKEKYEDQGAIVTWLNKDSEQFHPFDITVDYDDGFLEFIEVKTSTSLTKSLMEISEREIQEAVTGKEAYTVVCVFGAGTANAKMMRLPFVSKQWQSSHKVFTGVELLLRVPLPKDRAEAE